MPVEIEQLDIVPAPTAEGEPPQAPATPPRPPSPGPAQAHEVAATIARLEARQLRLQAD